jgi:flagellar hook-length control protein FliK
MSAPMISAVSDASAASSFLSAETGAAPSGDAAAFGALIDAAAGQEGDVQFAARVAAEQPLAPMPAPIPHAQLNEGAINIAPTLPQSAALTEVELAPVAADTPEDEAELAVDPESILPDVLPNAAPPPPVKADQPQAAELALIDAVPAEPLPAVPLHAAKAPEALVQQAEATPARSADQSASSERQGSSAPTIATAAKAAELKQSAALSPPPEPAADESALAGRDAAPARVTSPDGGFAQTITNSADQADSSLPSSLLTQTLAPVTSRPTGSPYPQAIQPQLHQAVVHAEPGRFGADMGVEIARAVKGEREDLLIRLDPREMGRIDVRLSFDRDGVLRAVMSTESPAALEMLRRESADLNRALADAGVRSDGQSLRFDARSGEGADQGAHRWKQDRPGGSNGSADGHAGELSEPQYRPLRASGQVDLIA